MNTTQAATATARMSQAVLPRASEINAANFATPRRGGYGMPCAKCKTYYSADLDSCPVCKTTERVSPIPAGAAAVEATEPELTPDEAALEFLRFWARCKRYLTKNGDHCALSVTHFFPAYSRYPPPSSTIFRGTG